MLRTNLLKLTLLAALIPLNLHADETTDAIKAQLQKSSPNLKIKSVQPSPVPGLYEAFASGNIFYTDKAGNYVLAGATLFEISSKRDLTTESLKKLTAIKFDTLPFKDAIEIRKGNGSYKFAVFSDPDCPYCKQLEQGLEKSGLTDYTAYVFLMPLEDLHKEARWKSEALWCTPDRAAAWHAWMVEGKLPEKTTCENPIDSNKKLAENLGVAATPSIYLNNGNLATAPQELVNAIKQNQETQASSAAPATAAAEKKAL